MWANITQSRCEAHEYHVTQWGHIQIFAATGGSFLIKGKLSEEVAILERKVSDGSEGPRWECVDRESAHKLPTTHPEPEDWLYCRENSLYKPVYTIRKYNIIIMGEVAPFASIMETSNRAKALVAGNFSLEGQDATEGSQQLVMSLNNFWDVTVHGLQLKLCFLFTNLIREH